VYFRRVHLYQKVLNIIAYSLSILIFGLNKFYFLTKINTVVKAYFNRVKAGILKYLALGIHLESNSQKEKALASFCVQRVLITQQRPSRVMVKCGLLHDTPMGRVHYVRRSALRTHAMPFAGVAGARRKTNGNKNSICQHQIHRCGGIL
jgi:hypothetical protein